MNQTATLVDFVDVQVGTDNRPGFGNGNVLPLTALPWGTHHFSPVNRTDQDRWFYTHEGREFSGLRLTHQPSPWMGDWCWLTMLPQVGTLRCHTRERLHPMGPGDLQCAPDKFACRLPDGIAWMAVPTRHGLAMEIAWPETNRRRLILDATGLPGSFPGADIRFRLDHQSGYLFARIHSGLNLHRDFALHLALRIRGARIVGGGVFDHETHRPGLPDTEGRPGTGAWIEVAVESQVCRCDLAGSFIDPEAARQLLDREIGDESIHSLHRDAVAAWNEILGRIEVPGLSHGNERLLRTMQYRTALFPRRLDEPDEKGRPRHRCPDTGTIRSGVRSADQGFWDAARACASLSCLLYPDHLATQLEGWLAVGRSTGWLPCWSSPNHRACMTGTYAEVIFAEALAHGIEVGPLDEVLALLRRHVEEPVPDGSPFGREALKEYLNLGYIPHERLIKSVARTLDYAYGDGCIARIAAAAGDEELARRCRKTAGNWKQVLCPETGFFRGRHADGSWLKPFDPFAWGGPYVEGSAWQFAWAVPHQPGELIAARGGPEAARAFLQELLQAPPRFDKGTYPEDIHEMLEMAAVDFGQYAHSNQPSHGILNFLAHCGDLEACDHWRRRVCTELYRATPDGLPGDEDNGEMASWFLGAVFGLLPDAPGSGRWIHLPPLWPGIVLHVPGRTPVKLGTTRA